VFGCYGSLLAALAMRDPPDHSGQPRPVELVRDLQSPAEGSTRAQAGVDALAAALPAPEPAPEPAVSVPRLEEAVPVETHEQPVELAIPLPRLEDAIVPPPLEAPPVEFPPPPPPPTPPTPPTPQKPAPRKEAERPRPRPEPNRDNAAPGGAGARQPTAPVGAATGTGDVAARAPGAGSEGDPALARYAAQVHRLLQARANALGLENMSGIVSITFVIDEGGRVRSHDLSRPSGDQHIDRAMRRLMASTTFPPPPGGRFAGTVTIRIR